MTPERWRQVEEMLHAALARGESERVAYLVHACAGDVALRREVELLLAQQASMGGFLEDPAVASVAQIVSEPAASVLTGRRLGVYQVQALLGVGGMGEVYRAHDTRLRRDVAIKILPRAFTADRDRLARFEREARVLASLNHPHIGAIYGLEESEGVRALVLELVEGDTLAERITRAAGRAGRDGRRPGSARFTRREGSEGSALPMDEALQMARQIADALDAAHEKGIVHRDLKPANIKITPAGVVKVLDFGLAKPHEPSGVDLTDAPTVTAIHTGDGAILGTAPYMSPEQARGQAVDKRTDIWAFGCVLYEMLAGRTPFARATLTDTLAAIVDREPDWSALAASTPSAVQRLLRRCLDKDPRRRLRDIGEARVALENATAGDVEVVVTTVPERASWARTLTLGLVLLFFIGLAVGAGVWLATRPSAPQVSRLSIVPPPEAPLSEASLALSPDGRRIVYVSNNGTQLSVRAIDELVPNHIANLGSPRQPFISPDGQWIGFFDGMNALKKVPITGGPAVFLASLGGAGPRGASWSSDGTIIFATDDPATGLWRVSETGSAPVLLTKREQGDHTWPHVLPGGQAVLFTQFSAVGDMYAPEVAVFDLMTGAQKVLMPGSHAQYVPTGHLLYNASGTLRAVGFDVGRLEVLGISVPVLNQMTATRDSPSGVSVASSGFFAYVSGLSGGPQDVSRQLVWVDRQGMEESLGAPLDAYAITRVSPDGTKVVIDSRDEAADGLTMWDINRKTLTRFTFGRDAYPLWTPDGRRVVFTSFDAKTGVGNLFWRSADGTATPERLSEASKSRYATSFTPDGARLVFREEAGPAGLDIGMLMMGSERQSEPLIQTEFSELNPEISPDGRWLAYESNQSGRAEIYVRPFPDVDAGLWQVSTSGGIQPAWTRNGRELFYRTQDGALMAVPIEVEPDFLAGAPTRVLEGRHFRGSPYRTYDVSPDGKRFLMITRGGGPGSAASPPSITVVLNWDQELKRLVPTP